MLMKDDIQYSTCIAPAVPILYQKTNTRRRMRHEKEGEDSTAHINIKSLDVDVSKKCSNCWLRFTNKLQPKLLSCDT